MRGDVGRLFCASYPLPDHNMITLVKWLTYDNPPKDRAIIIVAIAKASCPASRVSVSRSADVARRIDIEKGRSLEKRRGEGRRSFLTTIP